MNCRVMLQRRRSRRSRDILLLHGAQLGAPRGKRRRRSRWARGAAVRGARRGAVPCSETILVPGKTPGSSGRGTIGFETRSMGPRQSQMARWRARPGSPGVWRGCCTRGLACWLLGWLSTSLEPATRVSRRQRCGWSVRHSSWRGSRAVCCALRSAYSRSLAAAAGPTTRRAEDCPGAGRAKRCRWRVVGAGAGPAPAQRSAPRRAASTRRRATSPACPAARRTNACAGTAPPLLSPSQLLRPRSLLSTRRCPRPPPPPCRPRCSRPPAPAAPRRATSHSPAGQTASSFSAPPSYAPNPQAIKVVAILQVFIRTSYSPNAWTVSVT